MHKYFLITKIGSKPKSSEPILFSKLLSITKHVHIDSNQTT